MKHIKLYEEFLFERYSQCFSLKHIKEGDIVKIEGRDVIVVKFLTWTINKEALCISFEGRMVENNIPVTVRYDEGESGYVFSTDVAGDDIKKSAEIHQIANPRV